MLTIFGLAVLAAGGTSVAAMFGKVDIKREIDIPVVGKTFKMEFSREHPMSINID